MKRAILIYMMLCLIAPITMEAKKKKFGGNLYWELTEDGTFTISGNGKMSVLKEHKSHYAYQAKKYPWYNKRDMIRKVIIEEGVTSIGDFSFEECEHLISITIPNSMKSIGKVCSNRNLNFYITNINVWCDINKNWGIPYYCLFVNNEKVEKLVIPSSFTNINHFAFCKCISLTSISIPKSVTSIGDGAFSDCKNLTSISIPNSVTSIGDRAFSDCKNLTSISIPNSVTSIGRNAFEDCKNLTSISIPNSVTEIEFETFYGCENLISVTIPNSVTSISYGAFYGCKNLTSISIPNSVTKISQNVFYGCENLDKISISKSLTKVDKDAFTIKINYSYGLVREGIQPFEGVILSMPDFMLKGNPEQWGLSKASVERYKNGIKDDNGIFIIDKKDGWKVTTCQLEDCSLYQVEENGKVGLVDATGTWVVPLEMEYSKIEPAGENYIRVRDKNWHYGIITANGKEVIPTSRGYSSIGNYNKNNKTFSFIRNRNSGFINEQGVESSVTKLPPSKYDIMSKGGYADATEITNGGKKYFKVSKGGKYGLTDAEGNKIIPAEMEALEQAGEGYLKYKVNGFWGVINYAGKIIIPTDRGYTKIGDYVSFTKRFPYEMNGYKGECNQSGIQISKISTSTTASSNSSGKTTSTTSTTSSTSSNKNSDNKTTTVVVEHHRDPIPIQEWVQCSVCWGSGTCQTCVGMGTSNRGNRCISCHGSGKCHFCNGQGGRNQIVYR